MERLYKEFKEMRKLGATVQHAVEWARMMRHCNYNPFAD